MPGERLRDRLDAGVAARVAQTCQRCGITLARQDCADDPKPGRAGDIGNDVVELQVHLPQPRKPPTTLLQVLETRAKGNGDLDQPNGIDKSALVISTPRRYRNREHLRYVAQQACLICGRKQSDPHHLRYLQPRALGRKASDEFAVPLCRSHHRAVHRAGDEQAWWEAAGIDPVKVARQFWRQTRLDPQDPHQPGLAARPETRSMASASDGPRESPSDQGVVGRADDGRTP